MHLGSAPPPTPIFAKSFVIPCADDSQHRGGGRAGLLYSCWKEKMPYASSHLETPSPDHKGRSVPWEEEVDLKVDGGAGPRGRAAEWGWGSRTVGSSTTCITLATSSVYGVTLCLEKGFRERPWACCVEWKHTRNEKILKLEPLEVRFSMVTQHEPN